MKKLKLHLNGKRDFIKELETEYNRKIKGVENDMKLTSKDKDLKIKKLKSELQRSIDASNFSLF